MNDKHKEVLRKVLDDFMIDLDHLDLVVHHLQLDDVLNDNDCECILKQSTRSDQVRELLGKLPRRGPNAFESFVKALNRHQKWLAKRLEIELEEVERSLAGNLVRKSDSKSKELMVHEKLKSNYKILKTTNCSEVKNLQDSISRLEEEKSELEEARENESAVHQKLDHENKTLLLTVNTLKDKNSCLTKELEEVKEARKNETAAHEELKANYSSLSKELDEVKKARDEEKLKNEKLKKKYSMLIETTHGSEVNFQVRISFLEKEVKEARENETLKNEKVKNDNETPKTTHCNEVKNLQDRITFLEEELIKLEEARKNESAAHEKLKNDHVMLVKKWTRK